MKLRNTILLLIIIHASPGFASWIDEHAQGWAWYEDQEKLEKEKQNASSSGSSAEQMTQIRKNIEEKLSQAILDPTEENIKSYIQEQKYWIDRSAEFAKIWARIVLNNPELDETTKFPVSQYGILVEKERLRDRKYSLISELSKDHGLFFFYEGENKRSQAFAQVVREFVKRHNWNVLAVSVDGKILEGFPNTKPNKGVSEKLGIKKYPSLVVVNPRTNQVYPIAFGMISLDQVENNISLQFVEEEVIK